ncbi:MAG TPA: CDP-diacylglycerol--serine O-phosphatidyltransferase [Polyangia bacterium]
MNLRKTYFLLPNLFTLSSVFCGFYAVTLAATGESPEQLYQAALAICFGFFFDTFDGRVARMTKTQSHLGMELDSLSDVITFGVAPAMLVYKWGLSKFGIWGVFISFLFVAAGALRLARFNVLTQHESHPGKFIIGLPIPAAAAVIVSLVVVNHKVGGSYIVASQVSLAVLVVVLSYLMISRVRFRSFKDLTVNRRSVSVTCLLVIAGIAIAVKLRASFIFVFLMSAYILLGLAEEVIFFRRRRYEELAAKAAGRAGAVAVPAPTAAAVLAEEQEHDEDVLRELGAYDSEADDDGAEDEGEGKASG